MTMIIPLWLILMGTHLLAVVVGMGLAIFIGALLLRQKEKTETPSHDHL